MSDAPGRHLIVTGGTGYIGKRVVELALSQGRQVTVLGHRPGPSGTRHVLWTLGEKLPTEALDLMMSREAHALIHLAHDWRDDGKNNITGTKLLFDSAREEALGSRVFISSQSAREAALNRYGRTKWAIEQQLPEDVSLRVGLVYGGPRLAMYGLLCRLATLPILPMIDPRRGVQPIHRDEVVQGIFAAIDKSMKGVFALAGPDVIPFGDVLRTMARGFEGRRQFIFPIPLHLALWACDLTARLPLVPTVDRERVLGLAGTEPIDTAADLASLGVVTKPFSQAIALEPAGRRALVREANALLRYAKGSAPATALVKRYVRACEDCAVSRPRLLLGWREPIDRESGLGFRLRIATRIAETAVVATSNKNSRTSRLLGLGVTTLSETLKMPIRLIFSTLGR